MAHQSPLTKTFQNHARDAADAALLLDRDTLYGQASGSVSGLMKRGAAAHDPKDENERKRKDDELTAIMNILRDQMLDQLDGAIDNTRNQIEQDQAHLYTLRDKADDLDVIRELILTGQLDPTNPAHVALIRDNDILEKAGVDTVNEFSELPQEEQLEAVDIEILETNNEITALVDRIESNLDLLDTLTQARRDLESGNAAPREIQSRLATAGIILDDVDGIKRTVNDLTKSKEYDNETIDITILDLSAQEQADFIIEAKGNSTLTDNQVNSYLDLLSDEALTLLENNNDQKDSAPTMPTMQPG